MSKHISSNIIANVLSNIIQQDESISNIDIDSILEQTELLNGNQKLNKTGLSYLWDKLKSKFIRVEDSPFKQLGLVSFVSNNELYNDDSPKRYEKLGNGIGILSWDDRENPGFMFFRSLMSCAMLINLVTIIDDISTVTQIVIGYNAADWQTLIAVRTGNATSTSNGNWGARTGINTFGYRGWIKLASVAAVD